MTVLVRSSVQANTCQSLDWLMAASSCDCKQHSNHSLIKIQVTKPKLINIAFTSFSLQFLFYFFGKTEITTHLGSWRHLQLLQKFGFNTNDINALMSSDN